jgi:arylsulfatase
LGADLADDAPGILRGSCRSATPPGSSQGPCPGSSRVAALGFHGWDGATSPNLDALAREARVYEAAWSSAPLTGPALSALMTGRPPEELGLATNRTLLAGEATTLAERLAEEGVETAAIVSNWVLRARPELGGAGLEQGFAHFDDRMESPEPQRPELRERLAPAATDAALDWLDGRSRPERSFFLWVHYQDPHGPYTAPAECLVPPADGGGEPELALGPDQRGQGALPPYQAIDGERRPAVYRARYEAEIRFFDRELGRLVDGLAQRGLLERALVVFTADHGESLGEHGFYFSHGQHLHRELLHVPLLLRSPGGASSGRVRAPASHLDLYPTLLTHFGLDAGPTRGVDLLADPLPPERVVSQSLRGSWSATNGRHHLLLEAGKARLFDLAADPGEELDLAPSRPELVRELTTGHDAFIRRVPWAPLAAVRAEANETEANALEALGYAGGDDEDEVEEPGDAADGDAH